MSGLPTSINLRDPVILDFVNSPNRKVGDNVIISADSQIKDRGFVNLSVSGLPGKLASFIVITCIHRQYLILKQYQRFGDRFLNLPLHTRLELQLRATLGVSDKVPRDAIDFIKESFEKFLLTSGLVDEYIKIKVAEFNKRGAYQINNNDFGLFFEITCSWIKARLDTTEEEALIRKFTGNAGTYLPDLFEEGKNFGDLGFMLQRIGDVYLDAPPSSKPIGNTVDVPKGTVGNRAKEEEAVEKRAREVAKKAECGVAESIITIRITSVKREPDSKWEPGLIYLDFPCGGGMNVPALIWYTRPKDSVLYATCTYRQEVENLKDLFLRCLNDAIVLSAITTFIEGDLDAGINSFKSHFWNLINERWGHSIPCVQPDIEWLEEAGEWKQAGGFEV